MVMGWRIVEVDGEVERGFVLAIPSIDGQDIEIISDGGWCVNGARKLFAILFGEMRQIRVSARCDARSDRNMRVLRAMGFVEEGRKRLSDRTEVLFGMFASECRILNRRAA
jgi:predicted site-specific integrase-resolvase